jgi:hypothetical protein
VLDRLESRQREDDGSLSGARAARNQELFRQVNERIAELTAGLGEPGERLFVCECGDGACSKPLELSAADYRDVRAHPDRFVVLAGHELPDLDRVVDRRGPCVVVARIGAPEPAYARTHVDRARRIT